MKSQENFKIFVITMKYSEMEERLDKPHMYMIKYVFNLWSLIHIIKLLLTWVRRLCYVTQEIYRKNNYAI